MDGGPRAVEEVAEAERLSCTASGGAMKSNGRRPRVHHTSVGKVNFERQRLRCTNCGQQTVTIDKALGMAAWWPAAPTTYSLEVQERCLLLDRFRLEKSDRPESVPVLALTSRPETGPLAGGPEPLPRLEAESDPGPSRGWRLY